MTKLEKRRWNRRLYYLQSRITFYRERKNVAMERIYAGMITEHLRKEPRP